jgi:hypothetical protein
VIAGKESPVYLAEMSHHFTHCGGVGLGTQLLRDRMI